MSTDYKDMPEARQVTDAASPRLERAFNLSILVSGIRCTLAYVVLPFVIPIFGIASGVGPTLGIVIGLVAIVANAYSIRRFWAARHPWRRPVTAIHIAVIAMMLFLVFTDVSQLLGPSA